MVDPLLPARLQATSGSSSSSACFLRASFINRRHIISVVVKAFHAPTRKLRAPNTLWADVLILLVLIVGATMHSLCCTRRNKWSLTFAAGLVTPNMHLVALESSIIISRDPERWHQVCLGRVCLGYACMGRGQRRNQFRIPKVLHEVALTPTALPNHTWLPVICVHLPVSISVPGTH